MSTHYFVDAHTSPFANSQINDVRVPDPSTGESALNANFIVRIPTGVAIDNPANLTELITNKYVGQLAFYTGFANIVFDDMTDTVDLNVANSSAVQLGDRMTNAVLPSGILESDAVALGSTPGQAIVTWEAFDIVDSDTGVSATNQVALITRNYREQSASLLTVDVSFDNGANFNTVTDGGLFLIDPGDQGMQFIIRFTNPGSSKLFVGSWAVIF